MSGLLQIRVNKKRKFFIEKHSHCINTASQSTVALDIVGRTFGFYSSVFAVLLNFVALMIGVSQSTPATSGLFGAAVVFLFNLSNNFQWLLRQGINTESVMASYERAAQIINLDSEKPLRTDYDKKIGLAEEVEAAEKDEHHHI